MQKKKFGVFEIIVSLLVLTIIAASAAFVITQKKEKVTPENLSSGKQWTFTHAADTKNIDAQIVEDKDGFAVSFKSTKPKDDAAVFDLFVDPRCIHCKDLEMEHGDAMYDAVGSGKLNLNVRPLSFMDKMVKPESHYSVMINSAIIFLAENNEDAAAWKLYTSMWENQPETRDNSDAATQEDMPNVLASLGVSEDNINKYKTEVSGSFDLDDKANTLNSNTLQEKIGGVSSPNLFVNGELIDNPIGEPDSWKSAIK